MTLFLKNARSSSKNTARENAHAVTVTHLVGASRVICGLVPSITHNN
ncbi:MAG: hypothetical protein LBV12_06430 [Puniceicoccales bacterium]|jgi:hypothetical protein|nr:hypothetical protein [Puniceicoccales bacterium]